MITSRVGGKLIQNKHEGSPCVGCGSGAAEGEAVFWVKGAIWHQECDSEIEIQEDVQGLERRIPRGLFIELTEIAERLDVSVASVIKRVIRRGIDVGRYGELDD